jgi:hypothetical protein
MVNELFSTIYEKNVCKKIIENCGKESVKINDKNGKQCKTDAMTYLACNKNIEGNLGEKNKLLSIKQIKHKSIRKDSIPNFPSYAIDILKDSALNLAGFGFEYSLKNIKEGKFYAINQFYRISRELRNHKDFKIIQKVMIKNILTVKLNPAIWSEIARI